MEEQKFDNLAILQTGSVFYNLNELIKKDGRNIKDKLKEELKKLILYLISYNNEKYQQVEELIKKIFSKLEKEIPFWRLIEESNAIAAGINKIQNQNKSNPSYLSSIFNKVHVNLEEDKKYFDIIASDNYTFNMPVRKVEEKTDISKKYEKILDNLIVKLKQLNEEESFNFESLVNVLEETCAYLPALDDSVSSAISFYDHAKLSAAVASCVYLYDLENGFDNFIQYREQDNNEKKFLFVSGEFSGIQSFIYSIISTLAMKSLRGRSFYLELFIEHIIDEILSALSLTRANLIYSGGSQFYLLLPNIDKTKKIVSEYKEIINSFLLKEVGTKVYYESSFVEISANDLGNELNDVINNENSNNSNVKYKNLVGEIFKQNSILNSKKKINRYSESQLLELFDENSTINSVKSYHKECVICKKAEDEKILERNAQNKATGELEVCDSCKNYIELGKNISKIYHSHEKKVFVERNTDKTGDLSFPKYPNGIVSLEVKTLNNVLEKSQSAEHGMHRFYSVNDKYNFNKLSKNIKIGNYNIDSEKTNSLIEFKDLVSKSIGVQRLAVLRADVDNLGTLFQRGFVDRNNSKNPYSKVKFSKNVVLSRYLSDFFKRNINFILEMKENILKSKGNFTEYYNKITKRENFKSGRDIVVVYAGGDDVFAIGTWNDIIEFSVDLRNAFKEFTNGKISLSAGIGLFSDKYPVYQMADKTGELEELAKGKPGKDSVSLFGINYQSDLNHVYKWDEFIDKVLNEKYSLIKSLITFEENEKSDKIFVGKSKWYKLMDLIKNKLTENEKIDVARYAYILARIKHTKESENNYFEFREKLFRWIKNDEDTKQLLTAINILIYEERGN